MDISIVILNYKCKGFTLNSIKSIKEADFDNLKYEIIVVDNNSSDQIGEILAWQNPEVKFIQSGRNIGMGAGNNIGMRKAAGKYVVVMNPDTLAFKDTFTKLHKYMEENPDVGIAGPKQYYPDRSIQDTAFRWLGLLTPIYRRSPLGRLQFARRDLDRFLMKDYNNSRVHEADWLMGSFLFCRAKALEEVGLFDERYFLYFEDTDLCKRFWNKHWRVIYFPEAEIIHNHARQSAQEPWYRFFTSRASRTHIISWAKYLIKWGL